MSSKDNETDSDDELTLSSNALAALQEFRLEEQQRQEEFQQLFNAAEKEHERRKQGIDLFKEDWQLSQFWYTNETADLLAEALLDGADENTVIAIVSAPSVYAALKKKPDGELPTKNIYLFEFDKRFELLAGKEHFRFYDFADPLNFDEKLKGKIHSLLIDPPFLNEHCQTNSSITAKALLAGDLENGLASKENHQSCHLISCTGERMAKVISKVYPGTKITTFQPEHANGLSNEFRCYANFEWKGWKFTS